MLLFVMLVMELVLATLLIVPVLDRVKQRVVSWLDSQEWLSYLKVLLILIIILDFATFIVSYQNVLKYSPIDTSTTGQDNHHRLVEAERDRYLAAFTLILLLLVHRIYAMLKRNNHIELKFQAMEKQAQNSLTTCQSLMEEKSKLESQITILKNSCGGIEKADKILKSEQMMQAANKEIEAKKKELEDANKNLELVRKQAENQSKEYLRVLEENKRLKTNVEDLQLLAINDKPKKD